MDVCGYGAALGTVGDGKGWDAQTGKAGWQTLGCPPRFFFFFGFFLIIFVVAWDRSHGLNFLTYARALLSRYLGHGVGYFVGVESGLSVSHRPAKSATLTYYFRAGKEKESFEMRYVYLFY